MGGKDTHCELLLHGLKAVAPLDNLRLGGGQAAQNRVKAGGRHVQLVLVLICRAASKAARMVLQRSTIISKLWTTRNPITRLYDYNCMILMI